MTGPADNPETVLVVDDSPESLGFLTEALEAGGRRVLVASSGEAALRIVDRLTPDLILMDAVMPGMDGFETCRRLKALPAIAPVPVIFMTGLTETEHVVHALNSGGVDYLSKPIDIDELRARIRVHLANARSAQSARIALDATGRHLVALSDGRLLWATPEARRLLGETALGELAAGIPGWIARRVLPVDDRVPPPPLTGARGELLQLAYLGAIGPDEQLFRLMPEQAADSGDALRRHFGLTPREGEVLMWIARGKSNKDIGQILTLSPRTVNKHLEQIYAKLGVENRASAAIKAMQAVTVRGD